MLFLIFVALTSIFLSNTRCSRYLTRALGYLLRQLIISSGLMLFLSCSSKGLLVKICTPTYKELIAFRNAVTIILLPFNFEYLSNGTIRLISTLFSKINNRKPCSTPPRLHYSVLTMISLTPVSITSICSLHVIQPISLTLGTSSTNSNTKSIEQI